MPAEDPKAVIRRRVEAWNAQDLDAAEELLAPESVPEPPRVVLDALCMAGSTPV